MVSIPDIQFSSSVFHILQGVAEYTKTALFIGYKYIFIIAGMR